ncbi:PREDICTED: FGFR1 oncogene partner 2 homolog [Dufourea novaeangliae]|uniref:FGFR1 oncogene partner 2 like protein n=1 Tax=Dufourea novaeangliae TaxID=178035 RepID=A0A154NZF1_DUFNO|nr:PREDICTED: FGFR1 oncogene partner 2 homolog [Dufourea novaeangliae]XP_015430585.1 PREDICTED: FGFR1 oncogene partner 2 homolog [Dufourea novaeangliae]KZC04250.1 FGFR1 oncogene partner 2 like protein [Dufourea novaeangliae]
MSLTFQQIVLDAKKLVIGIAQHEIIADDLISDIESVSSQISNMKQYQEEIEILNTEARHRPHVQLIASIHRENKHLQEIQTQNKQLKNALEDHQHALELIMSKYRQQTAALLRLYKTDLTSLHNSKYANIIASQADTIHEMIAVMKTAAALDQESELQEKEMYYSLKEENATLREIVNIANKYGSLNKETEAKNESVQTDPVDL